jgi:mono/diheme cytochrome c family protein
MLLVAGVRATFADEIGEGGRAFKRYCAACHGIRADGHGFVARALIHPPTDLVHLSEGNDTSLLAERLTRAIDGRKLVTAHGERDMPVWGDRFEDIQAAEGAPREKAVRDRINAIVAYILSIQVKTQP